MSVVLKIKGNQLSVAGVKYTLPNEFYIDVNGFPLESENGLCFVTPDKACTIQIHTAETNSSSVEEDIKELLSEGPYTIYEEPSWCSLNGLKAIKAVYASSKNEYFEMQFEPVGKNKEHVEVLLTTYKNTIGIKEVLDMPDIQQFLSNFFADEN